jgi:hypothetical protein
MEVECPGCGKKVTVRNTRLETALEIIEKTNERSINTEYERICGIAAGFTSASKGILILYFITAGFVWFAAIGGTVSDAFWLVYVGGVAVAASAWCYLVAQIIYIRAALERQRD